MPKKPIKNQPKAKKPAESKPKAPPMSLSDLAQSVGISRKALDAAIERGEVPADCLARGPNGRVLLDAGRARKALEAARQSKPIREAGGDAEPASGELPEGVDPMDPETWPLHLRGLKTIREWWVAMQAKRKDQLAAGLLVPSGDVRRDWFEAAQMVREHLQKIPDRLSTTIAAKLGVRDVDSVRDLLRTEIDRALSDLSGSLESKIPKGA